MSWWVSRWLAPGPRKHGGRPLRSAWRWLRNKLQQYSKGREPFGFAALLACFIQPRPWQRRLSCPRHGKNNRCGAGDSIATGIHMCFAGFAGGVGGNATPFLRGQVGGGLFNQRVGTVANGDNDRFNGEIKRAVGLGNGRRRPRSSGSPSSISTQVMARTKPFSSPRMAVGLVSMRKITPSSRA